MSDAARVKAKEVLQQYVEALGAMGNALLPEWSKCRNGLLDRIAGALDAFVAKREQEVWEEAAKLAENWMMEHAEGSLRSRALAAALRALGKKS